MGIVSAQFWVLRREVKVLPIGFHVLRDAHRGLGVSSASSAHMYDFLLPVPGLLAYFSLERLASLIFTSFCTVEN